LFCVSTDVANIFLIFVPDILGLSLLTETIDNDTSNQVIEDNCDEAKEEVNIKQE
jgi:hypothetical protein